VVTESIHFAVFIASLLPYSLNTEIKKAGKTVGVQMYIASVMYFTYPGKTKAYQCRFV
jgi:hypothetical protein